MVNYVKMIFRVKAVVTSEPEEIKNQSSPLGPYL